MERMMMQAGYAPDEVRRAMPEPARRHAVGWWLLALAGMVLLMVLLGGLTRLTGSGLSMVEWRPLSMLPPLNNRDWQAMFGKYQTSPQYLLVNGGMTLPDFKGIFWLEYLHRLWGRLIGVAFLLPFVIFVRNGSLGRAAAPRLAVLFLLGGLQGIVGWAMVKSGLADRPEVSHYRLAAHLMAALLIYGALLWSALDFLPRASGRLEAGVAHRLARALSGLLALVCLTMTAGALVAGLHAGMIYNSFPLMGDRLIPAEAFDLAPWWRNGLENLALVQFDHRLLAVLTWGTSVMLWRWSLRLALPPDLRRWLAFLPLAATAQAGLGILTLLLVVPIPLAAAHQTGAFLLVAVVLVALHRVRA
jgi:cytochrome c oxidase assembly protein subunit 15